VHLRFGIFKQGNTLFNVSHNLVVYLLHRGTRLAFGSGGTGFSVQGNTLVGFMAFVGAGKRLYQHEVTVGTDNVTCSYDVIHVTGQTFHGFLCCNDVVGVGNPFVVCTP